MNTQEAQRLFYEIYDQWKLYHDAARKLRVEVTQAFAGVAQGLGVLAMLDSMEKIEKRLQAKMYEAVNSIKD